MLKTQLGAIGQRVAFVPSLMMVNREDCSMGVFFRWVKRQLLTAREPFYRQADVLMNTEQRSVKDVTQQALHQFHAATRSSARP